MHLQVLRSLRVRDPSIPDQPYCLKLELPRKPPSLHDPPPAPSKHLTRCLWNRVQARSSNLSEPALTTTLEWNYKVISGTDIQGFKEIRDGFEVLFKDPASAVVNEDWIARYEQRRVVPIHKEAAVAEDPTEPSPDPHAIQRNALAALAQTRREGFTAGL